MDNKKPETGKYTKVSLVLTFLQGNIRYFIISILSAMVVTGLDMISPQLIRTTVDSVLGSEPLELPLFLMEQLERIGGVAYLRTHIWVIGIAIVVLALFSAVFRYMNMRFNVWVRKAWCAPCEINFLHIFKGCLFPGI